MLSLWPDRGFLIKSGTGSLTSGKFLPYYTRFDMYFFLFEMRHAYRQIQNFKFKLFALFRTRGL